MSEVHDRSVDAKIGKRGIRILIGGVAGLGALYIDKVAQQSNRAFLQMALWSLVLLALFFAQFRESLKRPIQGYIAFALALVHVLFLVLIRRLFPFDTSLGMLIGLLPESIILTFLYARLGQALDPNGPFGLTEEERRQRLLRP